MEKLKENLSRVHEKIVQSAIKSGRKPEEVTLVVVTKSVSIATVKEAISLGVQDIGENVVQDAKSKYLALSSGREQNERADAVGKLRWHLIGHLQTNKVKDALGIFSMFHSVDSVRLAQEIGRRAETNIPVLLQANVSGEETKHGFSPQELESSMETLLSVKNLDIQGLMTMAPLTENKELCRDCFRKLRSLRDLMNQKYALQLEHLSMGMSQDYDVAIEEGATMVRVGSEIFKDVEK